MTIRNGNIGEDEEIEKIEFEPFPAEQPLPEQVPVEAPVIPAPAEPVPV